MSHHLQFYSFSNKGYEGQVILVECDIRNGFPGFDIIGLPDVAIKESRERVKTALRNSGFKFPNQRVLVSLSPASVPKSGSLLDLGIALSILFAAKNKSDGKLIKIMAAGELTLDGRIVQDFSAIGAVEAAKKQGCQLCLVPFYSDIYDNVIQVSTLTEAFLKSGDFFNRNDIPEVPSYALKSKNDVIFSDIIGLEKEKDILTLCAAGRHSILLFGPPGVGKTMLSSRLGYLLEDLNVKELNDVKHIYGCANLDKKDSRPPVRVLSHDSSMVQFTGGINSKIPGDGALSHCGILFLDEITSYPKRLLESVKETYDNGYTITSKSGELISYPACFMMAATMNACPCGKLGSSSDACVCTSQKILNFWNRVGNPLLTRFDIRIPIEMQDITQSLCTDSKPDSYYKDRIMVASLRQKARFKDYCDIRYNGQTHIASFNALSVFSKEIELYCKLFTDKSVSNTREILSIVALARTIADIDDRADVTSDDLEQAMSFKLYGTGNYFWRTIR